MLKNYKIRITNIITRNLNLIKYKVFTAIAKRTGKMIIFTITNFNHT